MAGIEDKVNSLFQTVKGLERKLLNCQEDVLAQAKFKLECQEELDQTKKELFQSNKKIQSLEATVESLVSAAPGSYVEMESSMREELASIKEVVHDIRGDVQSIKKDVKREVKRLSRNLVCVEDNVNTLTERVNEKSVKLDITDQKVERLQRVFNRVHASIQSGHDLREEVDNIKHDMTRLNSSMQHQQQQQQQLQIQQQQATASMTPKKQASASTPLTRQQLDELKTKSKFYVCYPSTRRLQTGSGVRVGGFGGVYTDSEFLDRKSGVFKTPTRGRYKFGGVMRQEGRGRCDTYLCEDREGRRELLGKTERHMGVCDRDDVCFECEESVCVWIEVLRTEGEAEVFGCEFYGELV